MMALDRGLLKLVVSALVFFPAGLAAQEIDEIAICQQAAAPKAQITCLEEAIRTLKRQAQNDFAAAPQSLNAQAPELGAEQVKNRQTRFEPKESQTLTATIAEASYSLRDRLIVILDNGQIWRQSQGGERKLRLSPKRTYEVEIKPGLISGYKMNIKGQNRTIRVERLK